MAIKNNGGNLGRAIATASVWAGAVGFSYLFHSFGILSGRGATGLVILAFLATAVIWD